MTTTTNIVTTASEQRQIARTLTFDPRTAPYINWERIATDAREMGAHFEARSGQDGSMTVTLFWSYSDEGSVIAMTTTNERTDSEMRIDQAVAHLQAWMVEQAHAAKEYRRLADEYRTAANDADDVALRRYQFDESSRAASIAIDHDRNAVACRVVLSALVTTKVEK